MGRHILESLGGRGRVLFKTICMTWLLKQEGFVSSGLFLETVRRCQDSRGHVLEVLHCGI